MPVMLARYLPNTIYYLTLHAPKALAVYLTISRAVVVQTNNKHQTSSGI